MNFEHLEQVLAYIDGASRERGYAIKLVAAIKYSDTSDVLAAIDRGVKIVAENKAQTFRDRYEQLKDRAEVHFIGRLQPNKVKYLIGKCALIHSCDCYEIISEIDRQSKAKGLITDALIEVNVSGELSKGGFAPEEIDVEKLKSFDNVRFRGLMTMLPLDADDCLQRELFLKAKTLFDRLKPNFPTFEHLSMGMSRDYKTAIECGSNMVRIGSAIFK